MGKWKRFIGGVVLASFLTACGNSNEDRIIGTWQAVYNGEKDKTFFEISEDRLVVREGSMRDPEVVEYRVTDTTNDQFILEIPNPLDGSFETAFEGMFDSKDKIIIGSIIDNDGQDALIRVKSIEDALKELEKEEQEALAREEAADNTASATEKKDEEDVSDHTDSLEEEAEELSTEIDLEEGTEELSTELSSIENNQSTFEENDVQSVYILKALAIEEQMLSDAAELNGEVALGFYGQYYDEWDDLLNEIWAVLKEQMPGDDFEYLRQEQLEWIVMKENHFAEFSDEVASERASGMDYLTYETTNRTSYIIQTYSDYLE